jgi:hypothetical protein
MQQRGQLDGCENYHEILALPKRNMTRIMQIVPTYDCDVPTQLEFWNSIVEEL